MKPNKKHIGKLFDVDGSDGSWFYQLVAVRKHELLFLSSSGRYEIESRSYSDWRPFKDQTKIVSKKAIERGWKTGRRGLV